MKFNTFSSTPGRVMVHIGLVLVQWFKRSPCGQVLKLPLLGGWGRGKMGIVGKTDNDNKV